MRLKVRLGMVTPGGEGKDILSPSSRGAACPPRLHPSTVDPCPIRAVVADVGGAVCAHPHAAMPPAHFLCLAMELGPEPVIITV